MAAVKNTVFLVLWVGIMIAGIFLGRWQLERLEWKRDLLLRIDHAYQHLGIPWDAPRAPHDFFFARDLVEIEFDPATRWLIAPRVHSEVVGAHVYERGKTRDGHSLWVNRGFVPQDKIALIQDAPRPVMVSLQVTTPPPSYGRMRDRKGQEYSFLWKNLGKPSVIGIVEASDTDHGAYPVPVGERPNLPNNHLFYAIFWFAMSGIAVIFGLAAIFKSRLLHP